MRLFLLLLMLVIMAYLTSCVSGSSAQPRRNSVDAKVHRAYHRPDVSIIMSVDPMFTAGDTIMVEQVTLVIDSIQGGKHGR